MTAPEEPVTVSRAATRYRLYVEATECAVTSLSAPQAAGLLIAHCGASPADAEAVVGRVYRTHGPDTGTVRCDRAGRTAGRDDDDVRRERIYDGERQPDDSAWRLELPSSRFGLEDPEWTGDGRPWSRVVSEQGAAGRVATEPTSRAVEARSSPDAADRGGRPHGVPTSARVVERRGKIMSELDPGPEKSAELSEQLRLTVAAQHAPPRPYLGPRQPLFETCPLNTRECENVMTAIQIIQLCPAPEDLWRFHAIHADTDGDAIVYISRVMALAVVEDEHEHGNPVPQRVVPIDADAMTYDLGLYDCVKPPASSWSTEAVHAAGLAEALELAEKWWRRVFHVALAGHDIAPRIRRSTLNTWNMDAGECFLHCPRCVVERSGSRDEMPHNLASPPAVSWDDL